MGKSFKFPEVTIRPDADTYFMLEMIQRGLIAQRANAVKKYVTHLAAQTMLQEVQSRIPGGKTYSAYRDSLQVVQAGVLSAPVFAVRAQSQSEEIKKDTDILYVKAARKRGKIAKEVEVLMKYQPWTQDTLPFDVTPNQGKLMFRRVSAREVQAIAKARAADRPKWQAELAQLGVRPDQKKTKIPSSAKAAPDAAYTALRLEFGLSGTKAVAHWRPALVSVKQRVTQLFKSGLLAKAVFDWKNDDWRTWRNLSAPLVSSSEVASYVDFEDKVT